ncbi:PREDICTED: F-box/kelch-repeat protein At3g06240-like [Fragaria vesca subsp. vesca]|uniref:F-box/kelch-repeat protein At3g06240-like n=1 Tax=Fragaria vesca subsp. vesca TaxID=101020 RepID=UPI0002C36388|nr:PREDICTED: F-box/kelch-repeat protein At3g06240-like [Fragaria vesca subsp. vesca]
MEIWIWLRIQDSWRRIQDSPLGIFFNNKPSTFASGALHWTAAKEDWIGVIVSFDLTSETYKEVPLPQPDIESHELQLGASRGCLCLLTEVVHGESHDIWVMMEYGVPESWTKTVTIPRRVGTFTIPRRLDTLRYTRTLKPLTWSVENGEILLYANGNLVSYNANKNSLVHFASDVKIPNYSLSSVGYEESLVSPNAYSNLGANKICPLNIRIVLRKLVNCSDRSRKFVQIKGVK